MVYMLTYTILVFPGRCEAHFIGNSNLIFLF
jgi:hypothetical protein